MSTVGQWVDTAIACILVQAAKAGQKLLAPRPSDAERRAYSLADVGYQLLAGPVSDWVGFYDCPCGSAYEIFDDSTPDDVARLQKWFDEHRGCRVLDVMSSEAAQDGYYDLVNGFIDTREPDEPSVPVGEHPDLDPQAVIGKRPDWTGVGVPAGAVLPAGIDLSAWSTDAVADQIAINAVCEVLAEHLPDGDADGAWDAVRCYNPHAIETLHMICTDWQAWREHVAPLIVHALKK